MINTYAKVLQQVVDRACKTCNGLGHVDDADCNDISYNSFKCPDCDGSGWNPEHVQYYEDLDRIIAMGPAIWTQTEPKSDLELQKYLSAFVTKTRDYFSPELEEKTQFNFVDLVNTNATIAAVGNTPNSPTIARILAAMWNLIYEEAKGP